MRSVAVALVDSLLTAMVRADGDALVMHVGERPIVVSGSRTVDLSNHGMNLGAMVGMLGQLLSSDAQASLRELGAVEHELPSRDPDHFSVVAARSGDDIWIEIRRRREALPAAPASEPVEPPSTREAELATTQAAGLDEPAPGAGMAGAHNGAVRDVAIENGRVADESRSATADRTTEAEQVTLAEPVEPDTSAQSDDFVLSATEADPMPVTEEPAVIAIETAETDPAPGDPVLPLEEEPQAALEIPGDSVETAMASDENAGHASTLAPAAAAAQYEARVQDDVRVEDEVQVEDEARSEFAPELSEVEVAGRGCDRAHA